MGKLGDVAEFKRYYNEWLGFTVVFWTSSNFAHCIFALKYWIVSQKIAHFFQNKIDSKINKTSILLFILQILLIALVDASFISV